MQPSQHTSKDLIMSNNKQQTVAILGAGNVGAALAQGFTAAGMRVVFGVRDTNSARTREALAAVPGTTAASFSEAARAADIAVVALPWAGLKDGLEAAGAANLAGKLVIDASNPLDFSTGAPRLAIGFTDSAGETVQRLLPDAKVVKAFNTITFAHMVKPRLPDGTPDMLIAGNDEGAKRDAGRVLEGFGWRKAIDMGDIGASRLLEPLAMLWISYGVRNDHWTHGFSLLGRKG
jgi:predicted dinucleotide-binding enzyme